MAVDATEFQTQQEARTTKVYGASAARFDAVAVMFHSARETRRRIPRAARSSGEQQACGRYREAWRNGAPLAQRPHVRSRN